MARTATATCNGVTYNISSESDFLLCFVNYYWFDSENDADNDCDFTVWYAVLFSGNVPIVFTFEKDGTLYQGFTGASESGYVCTLEGKLLNGIFEPVDHSGFDAEYIGNSYPDTNDHEVGIKDALAKLSLSNTMPLAGVEFGWTDGVGALNTNNLTIPQAADGWHCAAYIRLKAAAVTGYTLGYTLYANGNAVKQDSGLTSVDISYKIPNENIGGYDYYAEVTHTLQDVSTSVTTSAVSVSVVEYDYDNYNPDTGEDETGGITPGIVYPETTDPDNPDDPEDSNDETTTSFHLKSWLIGFALGLAGKPLPIASAKKEPVAYLYGEDKVRLPPLPEWDIEAYPYAHMCNISGSYYFLMATSEPVYVEPYGALVFEKDAKLIRWDTDTSTMSNTWSAAVYSDVEPGDNASRKAFTFWCNYNIRNQFNYTEIPKSADPIPVYE